MKRKEFIEKTGQGIGFYLLMDFLNSCTTLQEFEEASVVNSLPIVPSSLKITSKVAVIGAGISGIYAAWLLYKKNIPFDIYEAGADIGGRLRAITINTVKINVGSLFFGNDSIYSVDFLNQLKNNIYNTYLNKNYFFNGKIMNLQEIKDADQNIKIFFDALNSFSKDELNKEIDLKTYFNTFNNDLLYEDFINSFAAFYGTTPDKLNLYELSLKLNKRPNYEVKQNYLGIDFNTFFSNTIFSNLKIQTNKKLTGITFNNTNFNLSPFNLLYDYVILTPPPNALKSITFSPDLSKEQKTALDELVLNKGIVVAIEYYKPFWDKKLQYILGSKYASYYLISNDVSSIQNNYIMCYFMGDKVLKFSTENIEQIKFDLINEIALILGENGKKNIKSFNFYDWGANSNIQGFFTSPVKNATSLRSLFTEPYNENLYFCGDSFNTNGLDGKVEASLESSYNAVYKIIEKILSKKEETPAN